jgi:hypothetical protein
MYLIGNNRLASSHVEQREVPLSDATTQFHAAVGVSPAQFPNSGSWAL